MSETARCPQCQTTIERMRAAGFGYSARKFGNDHWEVVFIGQTSWRGSGATLHDAVAAAYAPFAWVTTQ